jgi:uncharacterized protein with FMN-binding domain
MKRAPVVLTATAAGLAATLGFTPHSKAPTANAVATAPKSTSTASSSSSKSSGSSSKTVTAGASTRYGNVQLKVTVAGGKITSIEALQLPSQDPKSVQISSYAAPLLRQSALTKQSANVDGVSGATYTSEGYRTALQSALDQAGLQAAATNAAGAPG